MTERNDVTVRIASATINSYEDSGIPDGLVGFIAWALEQLELVPEEFKAAAEIEFESEYESSTVGVDISYRRPETDAELSDRIERNRRYRAENARDVEQQERHALALLKAKYE